MQAEAVWPRTDRPHVGGGVSLERVGATDFQLQQAVPHNSHTVASYTPGCCAKTVSGKSGSQILVDINIKMPDTDIHSPHKLCDLVDIILPSAFGTMIKTRKDKSRSHLKNTHPSLRGIGKNRKNYMDAKSSSQNHCTLGIAQAHTCLESAGVVTALLNLLSVSPFPATKKVFQG